MNLQGYVDALLGDPSRRLFIVQGARHAGKTVLLKQLIADLIARGIDRRKILYLSFDQPVFAAGAPDAQVREYLAYSGRETGDAGLGPRWVFFDEIQYLGDWERRLHEIAARHPAIRFVACSSARKYRHDGRASGNDTKPVEWVVPPLSFAEYLRFSGHEADLVGLDEAACTQGRTRYRTDDLCALNATFLDFLNFGGFPDAAADAALRAPATRREGPSIIRSVLHRDVPGLYGIGDTRDLNRLFGFLAYNTGRELTLKLLSRTLELGKAKVYEYLEYLESTCLIRRLARIDDNGEPLQRARTFKAYLTNPSMWSAMFGVVAKNDLAAAKLAENAVFMHLHRSLAGTQALHYARWKSGRQGLEVDLVAVDPETRQPTMLLDFHGMLAPAAGPDELRGLCGLATRFALTSPPRVVTWHQQATIQMNGIDVEFVPVALHCYALGKRLETRALAA